MKQMTKDILVTSLIVIIIIIGYITLINYINKIKAQKRYNEIKKDIDKEMQDYIYIIAPYCQKGGPTFLITHQELIYSRGMDKEKFLDLDGKSYCKAYVETKCVDDNMWDWNIYISCKNYQDEKYQDWHTGF